jgi:hypothetical protein
MLVTIKMKEMLHPPFINGSAWVATTSPLDVREYAVLGVIKVILNPFRVRMVLPSTYNTFPVARSQTWFGESAFSASPRIGTGIVTPGHATPGVGGCETDFKRYSSAQTNAETVNDKATAAHLVNLRISLLLRFMLGNAQRAYISKT